MGREASQRELVNDHAAAAELLARAEAVLEATPRPSRNSVSAARRIYSEALQALTDDGPESIPPRLGSVRRLSRRVERLLWRSRVTNGFRLLLGAWRPVALVVSLGLVFAAYVAWRTPHDVLQGRPFRLSSEWAKCNPARQTCGGGTTRIFFHTLEDASPFIQYDLGRAIPLRQVSLTNRRDSGLADRAVPLVIETSLDEKTWHVVARRDYWFEEWLAEFPPTQTRYLRLRVARRSVLHLESVRAWE
jgi:hypothetical protein